MSDKITPIGEKAWLLPEARGSAKPRVVPPRNNGSGEGQKLWRLSQEMLQAPESVDVARIEKVRRALESGNYRSDAGALSKKIFLDCLER